jgi:hypothetical protein
MSFDFFIKLKTESGLEQRWKNYEGAFFQHKLMRLPGDQFDTSSEMVGFTDATSLQSADV